MDTVAEEAGLAKGLLYYYYKTKKDLFVELYTWMFNEAYQFSSTLLEKTEGMPPVEQLMYYAYGMFGVNNADPRFMQFNIRVPFDAYAVFGSDEWQDGAKKSDMHRKALTKIIEKGIEQGFIIKTDPSNAANSFWSVFVGNTFEYSRLIAGELTLPNDDAAALKSVVQFCFQGLGIDYDVWSSCLEKVVTENQKRGLADEGI